MKRIIAAFIGLCLAATIVWADDTLNGGLTLVIPSQGARNWGTLFKNSFATPISNHDHTGGGKGLQISTNGIATNAVTGAKIRLNNNEYLRARNASNSANIDILRLSLSDELFINLPFSTSTLAFGNQSIVANTSDGADNLTLNLGHSSSTRGGGITLYGNESAAPGAVQVTSGTSGTINFANGSTTSITVSGGNFTPFVDDGADLGDSSHGFKNLWLKQRTWTPSLTVPVGSTVSASSVTAAKYYTAGKQVFFSFQVSITVATATAAELYVSTPTASASGGAQGGGCSWVPGSATSQTPVAWTLAASDSTFQIGSGTAFATGVAETLICNGFYIQA